MKILSITAQKPHSTGSGIYLTELVNNWNRLGYEQAVVAGVYEKDTVKFPKRTVFYPVQYLSEELPFAIAGMSDEMPYESTRYQDIAEKKLEQFRGAFQKEIAKAVEEFEPDMIICHHLYLLTAMVREWYPEKRVIGICHGSDLRQIRKNDLQREYIKEQIRKLDGIAALHEEQKKRILEIFSCDEEMVKVIGAGYNPRIFHDVEKVEKPYKQLVFAGKVTEKKGIFSLFRALEKLPYNSEELVVKIAGGFGEAEERKQIQELAAKSKYVIQFLGMLSQRELAELFQESDVFVLPSFFEGLPLVTMEAMACGCKVVCTEISGIRKWLDKNVPGHRMEFVELPEMENVDEPKKESLPVFERNLADAIHGKLEQTTEEQPNLARITWRGISQNMLQTFQVFEYEEEEDECL